MITTGLTLIMLSGLGIIRKFTLWSLTSPGLWCRLLGGHKIAFGIPTSYDTAIRYHGKMAMDVRRSMHNNLTEQSWLMKLWGNTN